MSFILSFPSSSGSTSSLTSTTSAIALSQLLTGAVIAIGALIFLLALNEIMRHGDSWNSQTAAALQALYLSLIVTFFAWLVFNTAIAL